MQNIDNDIIELLKKCEYFNGNKELQFLYNQWQKSISKGIDDFANFKFFDGKNIVSDVMLFIKFNKFGLVKNELLESQKVYDVLLRLLDFHFVLEGTIFDGTIDNYTEVVNYFEFPPVFTNEDIDFYLNVIRKACFDYGLRFMRIEPRKIISYWNIKLNAEMVDKSNNKDILEKSSETELKEI